MMKSASSFGLPSESYNDNMSDKEILSDRGMGKQGTGVYNNSNTLQSPIAKS